MGGRRRPLLLCFILTTCSLACFNIWFVYIKGLDRPRSTTVVDKSGRIRKKSPWLSNSWFTSSNKRGSYDLSTKTSNSRRRRGSLSDGNYLAFGFFGGHDYQKSHNYNDDVSNGDKESLLLLDPYEHLLTIAIDRYVSCPEKCRFVHLMFPPWVKFRFISFFDEKDLKQSDDVSTHLIIVCRTNIVKLAEYAEQRRQKYTNQSVGLFHMADERLHFGEIKPYHKFDYVLRNYYWTSGHEAAKYYELRALGNHTCGITRPLPEMSARSTTTSSLLPSPRYGVHWVQLMPHSLPVELQRSVESVWPISKRPIDCSFRGRKDVKRSIGERKQMQDAVGNMCEVEYTTGFANGLSQFEYMNSDLTRTKIGLCPRGSANETHRLSEVVAMGGIPAIKDEAYLHAAFRTIPGIIGKDWNETAKLIKYHLASGQEHLEAMARELAQYQKEFQSCIVQDMDIILQGSFLDVEGRKQIQKEASSQS